MTTGKPIKKLINGEMETSSLWIQVALEFGHFPTNENFCLDFFE